MMAAIPTSTPLVLRNMADEKQHRLFLADGVNNALKGRLNVVGQVTLNASATTTTLEDSRIGGFSIVLLMPMTAHAATAYVAGIWFSGQGKGSVTLNHASSTNTDQTFNYCVFG